MKRLRLICTFGREHFCYSKPPFILSIGVMGFYNSSVFYKAASFTAQTDVNFIISCQRKREREHSGCTMHPNVALFFPWLFWHKWNMSSLSSLMQWPGWYWQRSDLRGKWELVRELGNKRQTCILDVLHRCAFIIICALCTDNLWVWICSALYVLRGSDNTFLFVILPSPELHFFSPTRNYSYVYFWPLSNP